MVVWEQEKPSGEYQKRVQMSEHKPGERLVLKNAARAVRGVFACSRKIYGDIEDGSRFHGNLSVYEMDLLEQFNASVFVGNRAECDIVFSCRSRLLGFPFFVFFFNSRGLRSVRMIYIRATMISKKRRMR